jgi:hypothetical protein
LSSSPPRFSCPQPFFCVLPATAAGGNGAVNPDNTTTNSTTDGTLPGASPLVQAAAGQPDANTSASSSAGIALTTIRPLTISVNESDQSVTVDAGVLVMDLLTYLSNHVTAKAPAGYTLPALPW